MTAKVDKTPRPRPQFVMPPPNDDLHDRGMRLWDVRVLEKDRAGRTVCNVTDAPLGGEELWLEPRILLRLCDSSAALQKTLAAAAKAAYSARSKKAVQDCLTKVFEEEYIVKLIAEFDQAVAYLTDYLLARRSFEEFEKQQIPAAAAATEVVTDARETETS